MSLANFYENSDSLQSFYNQYLTIKERKGKKNLLLKIFPNPFNKRGSTILVLPKKEFFSLSLYNATGRLVENLYSDEGVSYVGKLDKKYRSGVYILRLEETETRGTWKVIIAM